MMFRRPFSDTTVSRGSSDASMCSTTVNTSRTCEDTPSAHSITLPPEGAHRWFSIFLGVFSRRPNIALLAGKSGQGTAIKPTGFSLGSTTTSSDPQPSRDLLVPASTTHIRTPLLAESTGDQPKSIDRRLSFQSPVAHPRNSFGKSIGRRLSIDFGLAAAKPPPVRDRELIKAMSRSGSLKNRRGSTSSVPLAESSVLCVCACE